MPSTVQSLPPETIRRILELGAEDPRSSRPFLLATSLVCKPWRDDSQALLWLSIEVWSASEEEPARCIRVGESAAFGRFVTRNARMGNWGSEMPASIILDVLPRFRGLESLRLDHMADVPGAVLLSAALTGAIQRSRKREKTLTASLMPKVSNFSSLALAAFETFPTPQTSHSTSTTSR